MNKLIPYFERFALVAMEKRQKLLRLADDQFLELDLDEGVARFSPSLVLPVQVLGTESDNSFTWLWAWAEEQTEMPERLIRSSREMQRWLEQQDLRELAAPSLDLDRADGTLLSCIATEVCRASAFYRDSYEGGALFLLLMSDQIDRQPGFTLAELAGSLLDLGSRYPFDHRSALAAYLRSRGRSLEERTDALQAQLATGEQLSVEFNADGSVRSINGAPVA
jgi:hypothetical protein